MKIVLVAVPGSGKSTTLKFVKELLPDVTVVNYGDYMLEIAKRQYGITNRDEMRRKLPVEEYRKVQELAAEEIAKLPGDVIIDTHASIRVQGGFYPGLPDRIMVKLRPDAIVLMEFDPKDILERRAKDVGSGIGSLILLRRLKCINWPIGITHSRLPMPESARYTS